MCLAVPGQVIDVTGDDPVVRMGRVDFGGVVRQASLAYLPDVVVGDWVLVHAGFAISQIDEQVAQETLQALESIGEQTVPEGPEEAVT